MGTLAAMRPNSLIDRFALLVAVFGQALPTFWFALMMMIVFGIWWRMLPISGHDSWAHYVMPTIALGYYATPALMRLTRAGMIEVLGINSQEISKLRGRFTILPQDAAFQRGVPILDQLVFFSRLDGRSKKEAEEEVRRSLTMVGLGEYVKRGVHALSHGMVKRLGIAQAFLGNPEVIFLDEPTSGLDPQNARHIRDLVRELNANTQATVLISSHNLAEIQELCTDVAILDRGELVSCGPVDVITRGGQEIELTLSRPLVPGERDQISSLQGVTRFIDRGPERYVATLDLPEGEKHADSIIKPMLTQLLEFGAIPRQLKAGKTLEEHFLSVIRPVNTDVDDEA